MVCLLGACLPDPPHTTRSDSIDKLVSNLQVTDEERRKLVNTRIEPALMGTVLDFLYKEKHMDSVPPMLQLTPVNPLQPVGASGEGGGGDGPSLSMGTVCSERLSVM